MLRISRSFNVRCNAFLKCGAHCLLSESGAESQQTKVSSNGDNEVREQWNVNKSCDGDERRRHMDHTLWTSTTTEIKMHWLLASRSHKIVVKRGRKAVVNSFFPKLYRFYARSFVGQDNNIWREIFMPASYLRKVIQKSSYHFAGILKTMRSGFLEWRVHRTLSRVSGGKRLLYLPKYFRISLRAAKQKHFLNYYFRSSSRWGESGSDVRAGDKPVRAELNLERATLSR